MRFEPELGWGANAGLKVAQDLLEPELWLQLKPSLEGLRYHRGLTVGKCCVSLCPLFLVRLLHFTGLVFPSLRSSPYHASHVVSFLDMTHSSSARPGSPLRKY